MNKKLTGGFTLPGESGYEELTLDLAKKWGADVIRDSDGTELSDEIINAGYGIYSTICIIRDHNEWAKKNMDKLQCTFLMSQPKTATEPTLTIDPLDGYEREQFALNTSPDSLKYWQVFDRTAEVEVKDWKFDGEKVIVENTADYHTYTVNFLAYRIWEEISMYNHKTNNWDKEHLMQIDPVYPETQEYMLSWMKNWCETHPATTVVRFTSMFYNFVWIWGSDPRNAQLYSDWASYDFTVSPLMLDKFAEKYGYSLTSEDFINKGRLHATHMTCPKTKLDYMEFVNGFVIEFGKKLVDLVHEYGKKAYVFYDDSWVGVEPWGDRFKDFGFDGLIKCVFNGFEARLCAGVDAVETHEIRLHPYLFPVGLGGAPTFTEGGHPTDDAKIYWRNVRRALLRDKIDRIGLGGYLSLTLPFPDFNDYIEKIADEFRLIRSFHENGAPLVKKPKVAVLTFWGRLRAWTCSGHYHEHPELDLININESLSGLPLDVSYICFDDVKAGALDKYDVVINAGFENSAWSGGESWQDADVSAKLHKWVAEGGVFIGVNAPSYTEGRINPFVMADVLGVDLDTGDRLCHGKYPVIMQGSDDVEMGAYFGTKPGVFVADGNTNVLIEIGGMPSITEKDYGKGKGIYLAEYRHTDANARTLLNLILAATGNADDKLYLTDNCAAECAYYPADKQLVVINNSDTEQTTTIDTEAGEKTFTLAPYDTQIVTL